MRRFKTLSARAAHMAGVRAGPVWSRAYHDRALRQNEEVVAVARYVVAKPLRAGIAASVGAYPYWDAVWLGHGSVAP